MKKEILGIFRKINESKKGQIFPFLILILVIVIIAVMSYVNMAQVTSHKIMVSNAADAGALSGMAQVASACNAIVDWNIDYLAEWYQKHMPFFLTPYWVCSLWYPAKASLWAELSEHQVRTYLQLCSTALKATNSVFPASIMQALQNLEVAEAEKREGSIRGDRAESNLEKQLEDIEFDSDAILNHLVYDFTYNWTRYEYNLTRQRLAVPGYPDEQMQISTRRPDGVVLEASWPAVLPSFGFSIVAGTTPDVLARLGVGIHSVFSINAAVIASIVGARVVAAGIMIESALAQELFGTEYAPRDMHAIWDNLAVAFATGVIDIALGPFGPILPCPIPCSSVVFYIGIGEYTIPLEDISEIRIDDRGTEVQVSRFSPAKNLGLWQWKHGNITSGARAHVPDGHEAHSRNSFRINIREVWDGPRNLR